jgi:putative flippase GtrA
MRVHTVKISSAFLKVKDYFENFLSHSSIFHQFSKFTLVGILNTLVGYVLFFILVGFMNYLLATVVSHFLAVAHSYLWNRYWVFKSQESTLLEFIKFNSVYLLVLLENLILMYVFVGGLFINPKIAALLCLPVTTLISYFGHRHWSFKTHIKK